MELSAKLTDYFLDGDEMNALQLVQDYLNEHTRKELFRDVLTPAMYRIGELWEENKITVADEHLATAVCDFVVSAVEFRSGPGAQQIRKVMVLGPVGEEHYIGLKMVASLFREHGWHVRYLGPNLPLDDAMAAAEEWKPDAIALSGALVYRLPALKKYAEAFRTLEPQPAVVLGGRAVAMADSALSNIEGTVIVENLDALKKWLEAGKEADNESDLSIG